MGARVLVIEDNLTNLELLRFLLEAHGHNVQCATDGDEGLRLAEQSSPDLIVCDLHLPRYDGFQVAQELKSREHLRTIPLIAVTAFAMPADRERAIAAGYDGYFAKPITPETFISDLEYYLPRSMRTGSLQSDESAEPPGDEALPTALTEPAPQAESPTMTKRKTVLVVDDSPTNRELIRLILEPSGYSVLTAERASEAVEIVTARHVDLILSDTNMPDGGGLGLLQTVRRLPRSMSTPVLLISSTAAESGDHREAMAMGAVGYINRPIDPQEVLATIERCLQAATPHDERQATPARSPAASAPRSSAQDETTPSEVTHGHDSSR